MFKATLKHLFSLPGYVVFDRELIEEGNSTYCYSHLHDFTLIQLKTSVLKESIFYFKADQEVEVDDDGGCFVKDLQGLEHRIDFYVSHPVRQEDLIKSSATS